MSSRLTTLRHVLTQQKRRVPCDIEPGRNSVYKGWPQLDSSGIRIWDEFVLPNLNASYGHVLDLAIPEELVVVPQSDQALGGVSLTKEEDMNYLVGWNDGVLKKTLQFAQEHLKLHRGIVLNHRVVATDSSAPVIVSDGDRRAWVTHLIELDNYPGPTRLVVGLARSSSKWSGRAVASQLENGVKVEHIWPLRQLANACQLAGTPYGYIQTDEEQVVCRFDLNTAELKVAIMPIPWSQYDSTVLTTDLALWWLCMLAMANVGSPPPFRGQGSPSGRG
ncbi:hypothetical protein NW767_001765 [Fusarium falciforme]|nr:hypothetical protein NW767_001765 [Fusarium falciforme]